MAELKVNHSKRLLGMKVEQKVVITKPPAVNNLHVFSWNLNKN